MKKLIYALMALSVFALACQSNYDNGGTDTGNGTGSVTDDDIETREIETDLFTLEIEGDDINFSETSSRVRIQNYETSSTTYELKDDDYLMEILLTGTLNKETFMDEYADAEETTVSGQDALYATGEDEDGDMMAIYLIELEDGELVQVNIRADSQDGIDEAEDVVESIEWKTDEDEGSSSLQRSATEENEDKDDVYDDKMGY